MTKARDRASADFNGEEIIIDSDADTSITADTDDQIDIRIGGADEYELTASTLDAKGNDIYSLQGKIGSDAGDYLLYTTDTQLDVYVNGSNEFRFEADGDFHADGNVIAYSTTVASDVALKSDIEVIPNALDKIDLIQGYTFNKLGKKSAGIIAQELEKVLPEAIYETKLPLQKNDGKKYKTVEYDAIHGLLIQAIKELKKEIQELKNK